MKYSASAEYKVPRDVLVEKFIDRDNCYKWMRGLQSFEQLEGEPGTVGSKATIRFKVGKHDMEMIETVLAWDPPELFEMQYVFEEKGVTNIAKSRFVVVDENTTRWEGEQEFRFRGVMKFMAPLMKGMFRKQSRRYMEDFRAFVEDGKDVRDDEQAKAD